MKQRKFGFAITTRGVRTNVGRLSSGAITSALTVLAFLSLSARAENCESLAATAIPHWVCNIEVKVKRPVGSPSNPQSGR